MDTLKKSNKLKTDVEVPTPNKRACERHPIRHWDGWSPNLTIISDPKLESGIFVYKDGKLEPRKIATDLSNRFRETNVEQLTEIALKEGVEHVITICCEIDKGSASSPEVLHVGKQIEQKLAVEE